MNRVAIACLVTLVAIGVTPRLARADQPKSVAVLGLELRDEGSGIDERSAKIAHLLTEAIRKEARAEPDAPFKLVAGTDKDLTDTLLFAGCAAATTECMVKVGTNPEIKAEFLIYGRLVKQPGDAGFQVSLILLDVGNKRIVRTLSETSADFDRIALGRWGTSLYRRIIGQKEPTVIVPVDHPPPPPPPPRGPTPGGVWRKTAIVSGVVAAVAGGAWYYSFTKIKSSEKVLCSGRYRGSSDCVVNPTQAQKDSARDTGKLHHRLTFVETGVTIAAGGLFVFSMVKGFILHGKAAEAPATTGEITLGHGRHAAVVTPVVTADGAGAILSLEW